MPEVERRKLEAQGFTVLRLWNEEGLSDLEGVLNRILAALSSSSPPSIPRG